MSGSQEVRERQGQVRGAILRPAEDGAAAKASGDIGRGRGFDRRSTARAPPLDASVAMAELSLPRERVHPRVVQGPAAEVLARASRDADLLVVGTRGHGSLAGAILGSVSSHCVHHAHCAVVVVR